jgi:Kef-type K+ transport system membrane component KefB
MHVLDESHILLFLLQVSVLLAVARTLGAFCEEVKIPALAGEIVAGVLLGPTVFGRFAPDAQQWLFPHETIQNTMLETVSWLGVFFLLLASGFHVNVREAFKSGYAAVSIGIIGVLVPIIIGVGAFSFLDKSYLGPAANNLSFVLFLSVAGSITAISVVARALGDLEIAKTSEGGLALSACAVNDLFGWLLFTVVISLASGTNVDSIQLATNFFATLGFVGLCLFIGSPVVHYAARKVRNMPFKDEMSLQTLIVSVGLLCGAITQWLGIHAILGFFLAGTMVGSAPAIGNRMQVSFSNTAHAIFVPLFFATIGLNIDFISGLELGITLLFTAVAIGGKFIGAWIGARIGKLNTTQSVLMGLVFTPGGAMEIVVGALALELELIDQRVFVAIVFAALISSITAGPLVGAWANKMNIANK